MDQKGKTNLEDAIEIKACTTIAELEKCIELQRTVFTLPDLEISPVRHLVVTINAGGFVLGAYAGERLVGFVLSVPAFLRGERAFYSHMTAVDAEFQGTGIGAQLKWKQRSKSLESGIDLIKWTFEPWKTRNAFFNLEKLGAVSKEYQPNYYGVDYATMGNEAGNIGLMSDRLFAEWHLNSEKVVALAAGEKFIEKDAPRAAIETPANWSDLVESDPQKALAAQERLRAEFETAFAAGLVARGFHRDPDRPMYLMY